MTKPEFVELWFLRLAFLFLAFAAAMGWIV